MHRIHLFLRRRNEREIYWHEGAEGKNSDHDGKAVLDAIPARDWAHDGRNDGATGSRGCEEDGTYFCVLA